MHSLVVISWCDGVFPSLILSSAGQIQMVKIKHQNYAWASLIKLYEWSLHLHPNKKAWPR